MPKTVWIINQYASLPEHGYAGRSYHIGHELARRGHRVVIIAGSYSHLLRKPVDVVDDYTVQQEDTLRFLWIRLPPYKHAHSKRRVLNWFLFTWRLIFIDRILKDRPDVIIQSSPSLVPWLGAEWLARRLKAKRFFEVRDIWPLTLAELGKISPWHPLIVLLRAIEKRAYRKADIVLSNLALAHEHMTASVGPSAAQFCWLPNGADVDAFEAPGPPPASVTSQLPDDRFIVGYAGTIGESNAMDTLIAAAALLVEDPSIHFAIVGDGRLKEAIMAQAEAKGLRNISFIGAVAKEAIPATLGAFDACFVGARATPLYRFGVAMNKLAEYMIAGKPIVYCIDSGRYRPVHDARCGVEVAPDAPEELARAISMMARVSEDERKAMGERGKAYAIEHFDYRKIAKRLEDLL